MRSTATLFLIAAFLASDGCGHAPTAASHRIEKAEFLTIGGIEQWVTIRGDDDRKPVLLLIHGGPADVLSPFVATLAPYEHDFVLVQWDQRGAGKTFGKLGKATPEMTLDRTIADGIELAEQVHARLPKNKLILLGHSWGTVIGTGMIQKRPELFDAYVGTGQVSTWAEGVNYQFNFLKDEARKAGDTTALAALEKIGRPDPLNVVQYFTFSRPLRQHMNSSDTAWLGGLKDRFTSLPGSSEADLKIVSDGMSFSGNALIQSIIHEDLAGTAVSFSLPYCIIQGRHDRNTPTDLAKSYFDKITAPAKKFSVIEDAGHFALATHQSAFIANLRACPMR